MGAVTSPSEIRRSGFAHQRIIQLAHLMASLGWRVTSVFRPNAPSHSKGRALDVTPMIWHEGGFGPRTAELLYATLAEHGYPDVTVVSENDHVHIELAERFPPGPGVLTREGLKMNRFVNHAHALALNALPNHPIGDLEDGDLFEDGDVEIFDAETGDVHYYSPGGGLEQGGPSRKQKRKNRRKKMKKAFGAIATGGASLAVSALRNRGRPANTNARARIQLTPSQIAPQARALGGAPLRLSSSARQKSDPELQTAINARKALRQAAAPDVLFERFVGIGDRITGELPPNARLRAADVYAASTLIMANPVFAPTVFQPSSAVGSTFTFVLNTMLQTVLAATTIFDWTGDLLRLTASQLNAQPLSFTVTRTLGGVATTWTYTIPAMTNASELTMFNGRLVAAVPRFAAQAVTVGPVADPTNQITVVGLPVATYSANLRLLVPGDSNVEGLLAKMV